MAAEASEGKVVIPFKFIDINGEQSGMVYLVSDVVTAPIPFLIGAESLARVGAIMDMGNLQLSFPGLFGMYATPIGL